MGARLFRQWLRQPITPLLNFAEALGGKFQIYCKREDLNHTGAHKANNCMGQGLLVQRMGKKRIIAETGAGQHGVASATMAAKMGLECTVYMGAIDVERQRPNVFWMEQLGATVVSVTEGTATLKDAINAAMRDWAESMETTHYVLGTTCGPHPFPEMVAWFQSIIGQESRQQMLKMYGKLPDKIYACVGGGSNASGIFLPFLEEKEVELIGVEAGGHRGTFNPEGKDDNLSLAELVNKLVNVTSLPIVAAGAIMTGANIVAALKIGATAVQMGTAFLCCEESGTSVTRNTDKALILMLMEIST